jgi:uncharacterized protein YaiL (DUF2058 family)
MGGLKDQLLKAGLVNAKQVKQAQQQQKKEAHLRAQGKEQSDQERRQLQAAQIAKVEHDRVLNQERKQAAELKAIQAQIRQLIESHRLPDWRGELPFNFQDGGKIKRIYVNPSIRHQLAKGILAIAVLDLRYELIPAEAAEKVRERDEKAIVLAHKPPAEDRDSGKLSDDAYAGYEIPDDLIW